MAKIYIIKYNCAGKHPFGSKSDAMAMLKFYKENEVYSDVKLYEVTEDLKEVY